MSYNLKENLNLVLSLIKLNKLLKHIVVDISLINCRDEYRIKYRDSSVPSFSTVMK